MTDISQLLNFATSINFNQIAEPAASFLGGATGAAGIWSLRARKERADLREQIRGCLTNIEKPLLQCYRAIINDTNQERQNDADYHSQLEKCAHDLAA